ncbi:hypothetical protein, partial [Burkholderia anthina]|uniref:hypothetical protein n=1 Tax=Burkholderia anthina TaxID=179879 RepID=UPI003341AEEB
PRRPGLGNRARTLHERDLKRTASRFSLNHGWRIISHYYGTHIPDIPVAALPPREYPRTAFRFKCALRRKIQRRRTIHRLHRTANRQKIPAPATRPSLLLQNIPHSMRSRIKRAFDEPRFRNWLEAITRY